MNIRNRLQTSWRRWQLRWQATPTEVIVTALVTAVVMILLISMVGGVLTGCDLPQVSECKVVLSTPSLRLEGVAYDIDPTRGSSTICYTVYKSHSTTTREVLCTYEEVQIEKVCP